MNRNNSGNVGYRLNCHFGDGLNNHQPIEPAAFREIRGESILLGLESDRCALGVSPSVPEKDRKARTFRASEMGGYEDVSHLYKLGFAPSRMVSSRASRISRHAALDKARACCCGDGRRYLSIHVASTAVG